MERKRLDHKKVPSGAAVMRDDVTEALIRAFFREWGARGFAAVSLEAVAKRAGSGKAALYRRWPSKLAMARDALDRFGLDLTLTGDEGSLAADVRALLMAIRRSLRHPLIRRIVSDLNAEIVRSTDFADMVKPFQQARRNNGATLLRRGIARGELPTTIDIDLANDLLIAPLYWRMVVVTAVADIDYIDRLTVAITESLQVMGTGPTPPC